MSTEKEYSFESRATGEAKETDHVSEYEALITKHESGKLEEIERIVGTAINQACHTGSMTANKVVVASIKEKVVTPTQLSLGV